MRGSAWGKAKAPPGPRLAQSSRSLRYAQAVMLPRTTVSGSVAKGCVFYEFTAMTSVSISNTSSDT